MRVFKQYMEKEGNAVGVREFEKNLFNKLNHQGFTSDLTSLLIAGTAYDPTTAVVVIQNEIIARIDRKEDGL